MAYVDRVNNSIAATPLALAFHLTKIELGGIFSVFVPGYAMFQAPAGRLADAIGPRLILTGGVVWAIFSVLITTIPAQMKSSLFLLMAVRLALGLGEAVMYPASNCIVALDSASGAGYCQRHHFFGRGLWGRHYACDHGVRASLGMTGRILVQRGIGPGRWHRLVLLARDTPLEHPLITAQEKNTSKPDCLSLPASKRTLPFLG